MLIHLSLKPDHRLVDELQTCALSEACVEREAAGFWLPIAHFMDGGGIYPIIHPIFTLPQFVPLSHQVYYYLGLVRMTLGGSGNLMISQLGASPTTSRLYRSRPTLLP